jgi:hypothetical protein
MFCACAFCGRIDVTPIRDCNSRKAGKSLRMRLILERQFGGKPTKENQKPACRNCDSVLDVIGNCAAALKFYIHLGENLGFGKGSPAAMGYVRKLT